MPLSYPLVPPFTRPLHPTSIRLPLFKHRCRLRLPFVSCLLVLLYRTHTARLHASTHAIHPAKPVPVGRAAARHVECNMRNGETECVTVIGGEQVSGGEVVEVGTRRLGREKVYRCPVGYEAMDTGNIRGEILGGRLVVGRQTREVGKKYGEMKEVESLLNRRGDVGDKEGPFLPRLYVKKKRWGGKELHNLSREDATLQQRRIPPIYCYKAIAWPAQIICPNGGRLIDAHCTIDAFPQPSCPKPYNLHRLNLMPPPQQSPMLPDSLMITAHPLTYPSPAIPHNYNNHNSMHLTQKQKKNLGYATTESEGKIEAYTCIKTHVIPVSPDCPDGSNLNPATNRCVRTRAVKAMRACPEGSKPMYASSSRPDKRRLRRDHYVHIGPDNHVTTNIQTQHGSRRHYDATKANKQTRTTHTRQTTEQQDYETDNADTEDTLTETTESHNKVTQSTDKQETDMSSSRMRMMSGRRRKLQYKEEFDTRHLLYCVKFHMSLPVPVCPPDFHLDKNIDTFGCIKQIHEYTKNKQGQHTNQTPAYPPRPNQQQQQGPSPHPNQQRIIVSRACSTQHPPTSHQHNSVEEARSEGGLVQEMQGNEHSQFTAVDISDLPSDAFLYYKQQVQPPYKIIGYSQTTDASSLYTPQDPSYSYSANNNNDHNVYSSNLYSSGLIDDHTAQNPYTTVNRSPVKDDREGRMSSSGVYGSLGDSGRGGGMTYKIHSLSLGEKDGGVIISDNSSVVSKPQRTVEVYDSMSPLDLQSVPLPAPLPSMNVSNSIGNITTVQPHQNATASAVGAQEERRLGVLVKKRLPSSRKTRSSINSRGHVYTKLIPLNEEHSKRRKELYTRVGREVVLQQQGYEGALTDEVMNEETSDDGGGARNASVVCAYEVVEALSYVCPDGHRRLTKEEAVQNRGHHHGHKAAPFICVKEERTEPEHSCNPQHDSHRPTGSSSSRSRSRNTAQQKVFRDEYNVPNMYDDEEQSCMKTYVVETPPLSCPLTYHRNSNTQSLNTYNTQLPSPPMHRLNAGGGYRPEDHPKKKRNEMQRREGRRVEGYEQGMDDVCVKEEYTMVVYDCPSGYKFLPSMGMSAEDEVVESGGLASQWRGAGMGMGPLWSGRGIQVGLNEEKGRTELQRAMGLCRSSVLPRMSCGDEVRKSLHDRCMSVCMFMRLLVSTMD
eukprot:GHVQ01039982.1.p1 GENE.GHVQ01039982.1~~GHVQ01039982.1.p1  ORF type:complete len:1168 (-),score=239.84 GHVQ01039982.1:2416-5919(-)